MYSIILHTKDMYGSTSTFLTRAGQTKISSSLSHSALISCWWGLSPDSELFTRGRSDFVADCLCPIETKCHRFMDYDYCISYKLLSNWWLKMWSHSLSCRSKNISTRDKEKKYMKGWRKLPYFYNLLWVPNHPSYILKHMLSMAVLSIFYGCTNLF